MRAKSIKGKSSEEINNALQESMADGFRPTLAIVFLSIGQDPQVISVLFDKVSVAVFGTITPGEFSDDGVDAGYAVILMLDINPAYFRIAWEEIQETSYENTFEKASQIAMLGLHSFQNPAYIILASNLNSKGEALLEGMVAVIGEDITLIGGISADPAIYHGGKVFTNTRQSLHGIASLIIDQDKVSVEGMAVSGWKPVGTTKTVTKSEDNWVFTIDDQPALDMLIKYTGATIDLNDSQDLYNQIGQSYPLQVIRLKGSPTMKPPLLYNRANRAIMCGGDVPQGSQIRFSLPPDFDVVETVIESARDLKNESLPEADAMLVFSCIGRLQSLGPMARQEIRGLHEVWNAPLAGFFSLGEFGTLQGGVADFHGSTCSWVALKEK
jgi:hypothetical protein